MAIIMCNPDAQAMALLVIDFANEVIRGQYYILDLT